MAELKTKETDVSITDFLNAFTNSEQKREESL